MAQFRGIAIGGNKCAGKDSALDYLLATRSYLTLLRCKWPIVTAYEKHVGHAYDKGRDDAELQKYSREVLRTFDDGIVTKFLDKNFKANLINDPRYVPIIPDMRFGDENRWCHDNKILCLKIECDEVIRLSRLAERDSAGLANYNPNDPSERDVDNLHYDYSVGNETTLRNLYQQLERVISRHFHRKPALDMEKVDAGDLMMVINDNSERFGETGTLLNFDKHSAQLSFSNGHATRVEHYIMSDVLHEHSMLATLLKS